jgi:chromosome segregation ATPase
MAISMDALEAEIKSLKRRVEVLEEEYAALSNEVNAIDKTQSVVTSKLNTVIETLGKLQQAIDDLKDRPSKRWETIVSALIGAAVTAFIAFILGR